jgi:hypothetical protein
MRLVGSVGAGTNGMLSRGRPVGGTAQSCNTAHAAFAAAFGSSPEGRAGRGGVWRGGAAARARAARGVVRASEGTAFGTRWMGYKTNSDPGDHTLWRSMAAEAAPAAAPATPPSPSARCRVPLSVVLQHDEGRRAFMRCEARALCGADGALGQIRGARALGGELPLLAGRGALPHRGAQVRAAAQGPPADLCAVPTRRATPQPDHPRTWLPRSFGVS